MNEANGNHNDFKVPCLPSYFPKRKRNLFNEFKKVDMCSNSEREFVQLNDHLGAQFMDNDRNNNNNEANFSPEIYWSSQTPDDEKANDDSINCDWNRNSLNSSLESDEVAKMYIQKLNCLNEIIDNVKRISVTDVIKKDDDEEEEGGGEEEEAKENQNDSFVIEDNDDDVWDDDDDFNQMLSQIPNLFDSTSSPFVAVDDDGFVSRPLIYGNSNVPVPKMSSPLVRSTPKKFDTHLSVNEKSEIIRKQRKVDTSLDSDDAFNSDDDRLFANLDLNQFVEVTNACKGKKEKSLMEMSSDSFSSDIVFMDPSALFTNKENEKNDDADSFEWDEEGDFLCSQAII